MISKLINKTTFYSGKVIVQLLSCVWLFAATWASAGQASLSFTISQGLLKLMSIELVMPSNHLTFCHSLLQCLQSFPASGSFPVSPFFTSGSQSIGASASVLPINTQGCFPLELTGLISCCPREFQESSPAPQFENITSSTCSLLYGSNLTSIHNYW